MPTEKISDPGPIQDPSDLSVSVALAALRRNSGTQVSQAAWERVQKLPHLRRFIEGVSLQIAPDDPAARGTVSAALVSVVELLRTAESQAEVDEHWKVLVEGLDAEIGTTLSQQMNLTPIDPAA